MAGTWARMERGQREAGFALAARTLRAEASRRLALLFEPAPSASGGPSARRLLGELGVLSETMARKHDSFATAANPRPVMLLPGLLTHPARMHYMKRALSAAGHVPFDWGLGMNWGASADRLDRLVDRVSQLGRACGAPVALVGWSLGGLYAREIAWRVPGAVAMVITMGSPFSGDRRANNAWRIYQAVAGHRVDEAPVGHDPSEKPPVPTIALWSARDGFVSPRSACGKAAERDEAVRLRCTHMGFAYAPQSVRAVLDVLDRY